MIVYEAEGGFKLLSKMAVSSVKGAKREQKGSKKGAKREQKGSKEGAKRCLGSDVLGSGGGRGGPICFARPCLRRILKDLGRIWIGFLESV